MTKSAHSLVLSATRDSWRLCDAASGVPEGVRAKVLDRDAGACLFCGFTAGRFQEIHHIDHDHANHDPDNLAVICTFCHQSFHLGRVGSNGEAELAWLPEMSQAQVNHLVRAMHVVYHAHAANPTGETAKLHGSVLGLYDILLQRSGDAERRVGSSDPELLGEALLRLKPEDYRQRSKRLAGIRLLPSAYHHDDAGTDRYQEMLAYWTGPQGPFADLPADSWSKLLGRLPRKKKT